MADAPNLFPALTAEDRAKLAAIAGNLEALPDLIARLLGYAADMSKVRPQTPAIVTPVVPDTLTNGLPGRINDPLPLLIDTAGRINVNTARRVIVPLPSIRIPAGSTVSEWYPVRPEMIIGQGCLSLDAPGRLVAETINHECAYVAIPDPSAASADARLVTANVHGATLQTVFGLGIAQLAACTFYRYKSAVAVGGDRAFPLRAII